MCAGMSFIALVEPFSRSKGSIPLEWWLILGWGALGVVFARTSKALAPAQEKSR